MSVVADSPFAPDHPFSLYVHNLRNVDSFSWFTRLGSAKELRDYVWGVMNLRYENTAHSNEGFAMTSAGTVLFIAAESAAGSVLTCFPMDSIGVDRINNAINDEWEAMRAELKNGTYIGNHLSTRNTAITKGGMVHPDYEGSDVLDFINGATIVALAD